MIRHSNKVYYMKAEKIKTKKEDFSIRPSPFTDSVTIYLKDLETQLSSLNHSKNKKFVKIDKDFKETNELVSLVRSAYKILESLHPSEQIDRNNRKSILFIFKKMIVNRRTLCTYPK